jgi:hypothetical protein
MTHKSKQGINRDVSGESNSLIRIIAGGTYLDAESIPEGIQTGRAARPNSWERVCTISQSSDREAAVLPESIR